jgi:ferredoxin-like protein FixX
MNGAAQLAVDLQHQFNFVLLERRLIHLRPGRVQQVAQDGVAQFDHSACAMCGVAGYMATQQDAKTFDARPPLPAEPSP